MSYGEALPERLVRGIVLARLANFAERALCSTGMSAVPE